MKVVENINKYEIQTGKDTTMNKSKETLKSWSTQVFSD